MRRLLLVIACALGAAFAVRVGPPLARWSGTDICLDNGGRVLAAEGQCEIGAGTRVPLRDREGDAWFWTWIGMVAAAPGVLLVWAVHRATRPRRRTLPPAAAARAD
jgi:hypothetical protein